jgi:hypothetical protein
MGATAVLIRADSRSQGRLPGAIGVERIATERENTAWKRARPSTAPACYRCRPSPRERKPWAPNPRAFLLAMEGAPERRSSYRVLDTKSSNGALLVAHPMGA